jgi:hypothetical protein
MIWIACKRNCGYQPVKSVNSLMIGFLLVSTVWLLGLTARELWKILGIISWGKLHLLDKYSPMTKWVCFWFVNYDFANGVLESQSNFLRSFETFRITRVIFFKISGHQSENKFIIKVKVASSHLGWFFSFSIKNIGRTGVELCIVEVRMGDGLFGVHGLCDPSSGGSAPRNPPY